MLPPLQHQSREGSEHKKGPKQPEHQTLRLENTAYIFSEIHVVQILLYNPE